MEENTNMCMQKICYKIKLKDYLCLNLYRKTLKEAPVYFYTKYKIKTIFNNKDLKIF